MLSFESLHFARHPSGAKLQAGFNIKGGDEYASVGRAGTLACWEWARQVQGGCAVPIVQYGTRASTMPSLHPSLCAHSLTVGISGAH